jgi:hypothetical protein
MELDMMFYEMRLLNYEENWFSYINYWRSLE